MDVPAGAALRWLGHDASNEFATLNGLDRAEGYEDYLKALESWVCPGQNFAYADRDGTIAIWHNGKYPLRWKGQGRFVLDGSDPANDWRGWVPAGHSPCEESGEGVRQLGQPGADRRGLSVLFRLGLCVL